jgi:hypothetical protein
LPEELKSHQESEKVMPKRESEAKEATKEHEISQNKEAKNSWNPWLRNRDNGSHTRIL